MKPLKLNMSKFKKVGGDEHHTVMRHADGHEIRVMHKALSPEAAKQMQALPMVEDAKAKEKARDQKERQKPQMMSDGGEAKPQPSPTDSGPPEIDKKKAEDFIKGFNNPDPIVRKVKEYFGMADGGEAIDNLDLNANSSPASAPDQSPTPQPQMPQQPVINVNVGGQQASPMPQPSPQAPDQAAQAPQGLAQAAQAPIAQPQQADPYGTQAQSNALMQGIGLQRQGMEAQAQAQTKIAADQQNALQAQATAQQHASQIYQQHYDDIVKHQDQIINQINSQQIDPNRFWSQKSIPGKIGTAIGLILGGAGAGMTGQENLAYKTLRAQIDNDIDAQKAQLGKSQNLLGAYNQKLGNLRDATDMTRLMLNAATTSQLQLAAAKQGGPIAQAAAAQNIGKLNAENAGIIGQMALRRSLLTGAQQGMVDPAKVVNFVVPEGQRADANKELGEMQGMTRARDNLLTAFDKLSKINTIKGIITNPIQMEKQVSAIRDPLVAGLSKETAGRFTDSDAKMIETLFPSKGDSEETLATKRSQIVKMLSEKMNFPILQTYGIQPSHIQPQSSKIQESAPVIKH